MKRSIFLVLLLAIVVVAGDCSGPDDDDDVTEETPAAEETEATEAPAEAEEDTGEDAATPDASREPAATITAVDSGVFQEESWIRFDLAAPMAAGEENQRYSIEFTTIEGDRIIAAYNVEPTGDPFSTSFCFEETPSCPDGIFPIVAVPTDTSDALVFTFAIDAFANATNPSYRAFIEVGPSDAPQDRVVFDFQDGESFPLLTDERDPR